MSPFFIGFASHASDGCPLLTSVNELLLRAVGRSENPGVPVSFGGNNLPPLVEIGLTDLLNFGVPWPGLQIKELYVSLVSLVQMVKLSKKQSTVPKKQFTRNSKNLKFFLENSGFECLQKI